eukprot:scaffold249324_cov69-Cyclotella_meneghiniana.AAC.3
MATCQAFVLPENSSGALGSRYNLNPSHRTIRSQLRAGLFGSQETNSKDAAVPKRIIEIPVKSIKKGGLRMVLGLSLIGLQNTPDKGSWQANQASDSILDMYFKDGTKFSVVLEDSCIAVDRYGQASLPYLLQESVILHSILDELNELASSSEVASENRLLQLEELNAIEMARNTLPARQA